MVRAAVLTAAVALGIPAAVSAQTTPGGVIQPAYPGDCLVRVQLIGHRAGDLIVLVLDHGDLQSVRAGAGAAVEVPTGAPLEKGDTLRLTINRADTGARLIVGDRPDGVARVGECSTEGPPAPPETSFDASAYYGRAYDTFAPAAAGGYKDTQSTFTKQRQLFGIDFDYRLFGRDADAVQFWVAGETLHGVRSVDINCSDAKDHPLCAPSATLKYAQAILADQSSLEAYIAPRLEFARLQTGTTTPTRAYATARFGMLSVAGAPSVYKSFHAGVGLLADGGTFAGSQLEVGYGMNELFGSSKWERLKIDATLSFDIGGIPKVGQILSLGGAGRFFIEIYIDNDHRSTRSDSVQTFVGFDVDVRRFFGG